MLFAHDTEMALHGAAALVNTSLSDPDGLASIEDLDAYATRWEWTGVRRRDAAELAAVLVLRPRLAELWRVQEDASVEIVNALLREARALPQLVRHDSWEYHLHATPDDAPLADRMAVEAAMAVSDLIRSGERGRLRICAADDCTDVFVDLSKNRSRRFCGQTCGNRVNVAAFRARRAL